MKFKEVVLIFILFFFITAIFFYKTFLHGYVPFPGDLLISEYNPWKTYSYLGYVPGSYPNKAQYFDVIRQIYPWKTLSIGLLKSGQMPLWNPYDFSGTPLFANSQSAILYPLNILYFLFSQIYAWTLLVFLQPFLSGFFMYLYMRKIGLNKIASIFSGVSFAFSSFMTTLLEYNTIDHVIVWLPLILLSVEYILEKRKTFWIIVFFLASTCSLVAGHIQVFIYLYLFIFVYILYRVYTYEKEIKKKNLLTLFLLLLFFPLVCCAVKIFPVLELAQLSARSYHTYADFVNKILIQTWEIIMFFVPDFFGNPVTRTFWLSDTYVADLSGIGLIPLMFIVIALKEWRHTFIRFFLITACIIFLFITTNPITNFIYSQKIPFISSSSSTLSVFLLSFSLSVLAGYGMHIYQKENQRLKKILYMLFPVGAILFTLWLAVLLEPTLGLLQGKQHADIASHALFYETILFVAAGVLLFIDGVIKKKIPIILVLIICIHLGDAWYAFEKFNPFVPKQLVFPSTPVLTFLRKESRFDRFWGFGFSAIQANFATEYSLFSPEGYDPLYNKRYGEFIQSSSDGKIKTNFNDFTRSDAVITNASGMDFYSNPYRQRILNLLGVKYILDRLENLSTQDTFPPYIFKNIYSHNDWKIFVNTNALPRTFMVSDYKVFTSREQFQRIFFNNNFDPRRSLLLEEALPEKLSMTSGVSTITSYMPNAIDIKTTANGSGLLFLSDTFYPGWTAFVDKKPTRIYRADYTFRGIYLPAGKHTVQLKYQPQSLLYGIEVTILGIILFGSFVLWTREKKL